MVKRKDDKTQGEETVKEWKDKYLRALADYQNLLRRVEEEKKRLEKEVLRSVLKPFLEIYEDIERAEVFVKDKGLALVKEKFKKILEQFGVREVKLEGEDFNPETAEVIDIVEVEDESEHNKVSKVYRKAYLLGEELLQPGKVQVKAKKK